MADTSVTYERTMKVSYPREAGRISSALLRRLQKLLTTWQIWMCRRVGYESPDPDSYEDYTEESTSKSYKLMCDTSDTPVADFGELAYSERRIGMEKVISAINSWWDTGTNHTYSLKETIVQSSTTETPRWKGDYMWLTPSSLLDDNMTMVRNWVEGVHVCFHDETDHTDMTKMQIRLNPSTSENSAELTFKIWKEATKTQKKADIETWLVDTPLNLMGQIQAHVESCLSEVGFETEEPIIECHFDAKTESRSECPPDIIGRLRDAKQRTIDNQ